MPRRGFTLIELLIVVGIVAILATIAIPNFLEAQVRAKVSRVRNDQRVIATALEAYSVDHSAYPPASAVGEYYSPPWSRPVSQRLIPLTTPVGYIASVPQDPYLPTHVYESGFAIIVWYDTYDYVDDKNSAKPGSTLTSGGAWRLCSAGPDLGLAYGGIGAANDPRNAAGVDYDPTNGSLSVGDIVRVGAPSPTITGPANDLTNLNRPGILRTPTYREQYL